MKLFIIILLITLNSFVVNAAELIVIAHKELAETSIIRSETDTRQNIWTQNQQEAVKVLAELKISVPSFKLEDGEVLAILLNDHYGNDFIQMVFNKSANNYFADYAHDGIRYHIDYSGLQEGKKDTTARVVIFKAKDKPLEILTRGMLPLMKASDSESR